MFGRRAVLAGIATIAAGFHPGGARTVRAGGLVPLSGVALGIGPLAVAELRGRPRLTVDRLHGRLVARHAGRFLGWLPPGTRIRAQDRVRVAAAQIDARGRLHVSVSIERDET